MWETLNATWLEMRAHSAQPHHRLGRDRVLRLGEGALAPVPRRHLRHHRARRGVQLLAPGHLPRARRQHRAHPRREVPHPAALGGGRRRRARLLPVGGAAALGVLVRDLPPALPRPDLPDQGGAAPDPRAAHAALARRLLRPGEGGARPHPRRRSDESAKRLAYELHARLSYADIEEVFQGGLHEYLTAVLEDIDELGSRIQRAYLGAV